MGAMPSPLRSLILAVLVLAVPAHGYAAAAMFGCGIHHAPPAAAAPASQEAPCHGDGPAQAPHATCDGCSACAAASVPAIASSPAPAANVQSSSPLVPFVSRHALIHVPEGPERPPRAPSR